MGFIDPQNASWFASNMAFALPLVTAVDKALSARRWQRTQITFEELEALELETCSRIAAITRQVKSRVDKQDRELARRISRNKKILDGRFYELQKRLPGSTPESQPESQPTSTSGSKKRKRRC